MRTRSWGLAVTLAASACGGSNPENSPVCGFTSVASATMVLQHMNNLAAALDAPPDSIAGVLPARVTGHGTARVVTAPGPEGVVLGYEGDGFPQTPGFGLLLVDDSSEVLRGVLIYDLDPPSAHPLIGSISDHRLTLPLHGLRVPWSRVNDPKCPLFGPLRLNGERTDG